MLMSMHVYIVLSCTCKMSLGKLKRKWIKHCCRINELSFRELDIFPICFQFFAHDPMPQTEEQNKFGVKTVSCTVLFLDKCHYPMMLDLEGSWQWINARKLILVFMEEAQCIRCDWLMILQNIRWATDAWEPFLQKNAHKSDKRWQFQDCPDSWKYKTRLWEEQFPCDFGLKCFEPCMWLHVNPSRQGLVCGSCLTAALDPQ